VPPLAVDPETLSAAGSAVVAAGDGLDAAMAVLTAGFGANTGLDAAGTVFGLAYQSAAESLLKVAAAAINACRYNGSRIQLSAANYSKAEAASTLGGGGGVLQPPGEPVKIAPPRPPGTLGPGEPPPLLWALVQSFVDDVWPNGDVTALHAAAGCWRSFGGTVCGMQGALDASKTLVGTQQIAEGERINQVLSHIVAGIDGFGQECGKMAASLDDFANEVAHAHDAIWDLLHRLGSLCDLWHDVVSIFDGDAIDEIKKIAEDISAVMHNLGREARAMEQGMKLGMQVIDGLVVSMERDMRGMFTHFLGDEVGNPLATVFDTWVNANEGVLKDVVGMARAMVDLDPRWFLIDPNGAATTWTGMAKTGLINDFINPQEAGQANIEMFKSLLHLEDWRRDRPGLGAAENIFDVAALFLPGVGEASAGVEGAGAAARGAEVGGEFADGAGTMGRAGALGDFVGATGALRDIGKTSIGLTKDLETLKLDLPKTDPPLGGSPVGLPPPKPLETPVEPPPRTVESAPPGTPPPHSPAAPGGRLPSANPQMAAPAQARLPVIPAGSPLESASDAATHSAPASIPVAPRVSAPESTPQSGHPLDPPASHDGAPPGPGDGSAVHDGRRDGGYHPTAIDALTSDDAMALADYTGSGYGELNEALRSNAMDASQQARVDALNSALDKLSPYEGPVVRGSNLPPEVLAQYRPGEFILEKGFMSTTTNPAVAQSPTFGGNVEFRILSNTGRDISAVSLIPAEQEILFPARTKFFVLSRTLDPLTGRTIIEMIEAS
jgi:hypothetical protein